MIRFLATHAVAAARSRLFFCALAAAFSVAFPLTPLRAAITATGDVEPADPATWGGNTTDYVGNTADGALTVNSGSTVGSAGCYVGFNSGVTGSVTVDGAGSTWTGGLLTVGEYGNGSFTVTGGGSVGGSGAMVFIGDGSGSVGVVTVDGSGSTLNTPNETLWIDGGGSGTLNITRGATVVVEDVSIGFGAAQSSSDIVNIDGNGSTLKGPDNPSAHGLVMNISVGGGRSAKLNVTGGGAVNSNGNFIDLGGVVNVDGAGSTWTAGYEIVLGQQTYGTLNISGGGAVETGSVSVSASSAIGIDVGKGNALALTDTLTNNGTIRLAAGAGASAGQPYSPITATTWTGTGTYQALGGTWNNTTHQFTVSNVLSGPAGTQLTIDLENEQRVLFSDDPSRTGWSVGASFLSSTTSKPLSVTATTIGGSTFTALQSLLGPQQSILGGWEFAFASGYTEGDPAYLSFGIGSGYSRNGLEVWHFDGSTWTPFSADDLTYDGTYASFTVTGFSGYAVTTVPEPSMLALLLAAAMGIFAYGRWKTS